MKKFFLLSLISLLGITSITAQQWQVRFYEIRDLNGEIVPSQSQVRIWEGSVSRGTQPVQYDGSAGPFNLPDGNYHYEIRPPSSMINVQGAANVQLELVSFTVDGGSVEIYDAILSVPPVKFTITVENDVQTFPRQVTVENKSTFQNTNINPNWIASNIVFYALGGEFNYRLQAFGHPDYYGEFTASGVHPQNVNVNYQTEPLHEVQFILEGTSFNPDYASLQISSNNFSVGIGEYDVVYDFPNPQIRMYRMFLPDGEYSYEHRIDNNDPNVPALNTLRGEFTVAGNSPTPITLSYTGARLFSVKATDHAGNPFFNMGSVSISNQLTNARVYLNEFGEGQGLLPDGEYRYSYSPSPYGNIFYPPQTGTFTVGSGSIELNITYSEGYYPIEFTRTDFDGNPVGGQVTFFTGETTNSFSSNGPWQGTVYLNDGDYTFVSPFYIPQGGGILNKTGTITVSGAGFDLDINPFIGGTTTRYDVGFTVTDIDGHLVTSHILLTNKANGDVIQRELGAGFDLINLPEGEYSYTASHVGYLPPPLYQTYYKSPPLDLTVSSTSNKEIEVKFADFNFFNASITALGINDAPLNGLLEFIIRDDKGEEWIFNTVAGNEIVAPLSNGTYTYAVSAGGANNVPERWGSFTVNNADPEPIIVSFADCFPATFTIPARVINSETKVLIFSGENKIATGLFQYDENSSVVYLPDGTYHYRVISNEFGTNLYPVGIIGAKTGELTINGSAVNINVEFEEQYPVNVVVKHPAGEIHRGVNIEITNEYGDFWLLRTGITGMSANIDLPDGNYKYFVQGSGNVVGQFEVSGDAKLVEIIVPTYNEPRYSVQFINLAAISNYSLEIFSEDGSQVFPIQIINVTQPSFSYSLLPGKYSYIVINNINNDLQNSAIHGQFEVTDFSFRLIIHPVELRHEISFTGVYDDDTPLDREFSVEIKTPSGLIINSFTGLPRSVYLEPGNYSYTVYATGSAEVSASGNFAVNAARMLEIVISKSDEPPVLTYTISASTLNAFGSLLEGYQQPNAQTVTITNTGTGAITLIQPTAVNYDIGELSTQNLAFNGSIATFTVRPKAGLPVGTHNEDITVSGNDGSTATVSVTFSVTNEPVVPIVRSVAIDPKVATVLKGDTKEFEADVKVEGGASQEVTWSVSGDIGSTATVINQS